MPGDDVILFVLFRDPGEPGARVQIQGLTDGFVGYTFRAANLIGNAANLVSTQAQFHPGEYVGAQPETEFVKYIKEAIAPDDAT